LNTLRTVHEKRVAAVKSCWQQQIFSGRAVPPMEKAAESQILAFVKQNPGAVGYVSEAAETAGVRVLTVTPEHFAPKTHSKKAAPMAPPFYSAQFREKSELEDEVLLTEVERRFFRLLAVGEDRLHVLLA
jgi:hypothetical protein